MSTPQKVYLSSRGSDSAVRPNQNATVTAIEPRRRNDADRKQ